jgi:outer membrane protein OmpA-like peptidoglycan-associated protein
MRVLWLVGVASLGAAAGLAAQHGHEYEFDLFGAYTKYDPSFGLANAGGAGARLGYLFGDVVGIELDVLFQQQYNITATGSTMQPLIGGVSLNVNLLHGEREMLYLLGGYSVLDFGTQPPYQFTDNGIHGAVGDRLFLSHHLALRVEGGAIYTPSTTSTFTTRSPVHLVATAGLAIFAGGTKKPAITPAPPAPAPQHPVAAAPPPPPAESIPPTPAPQAIDTMRPPAVTPPPAQPATPPPPPVAAPTPSVTRCTNVPPGTPVDSLGCPLAAAAPVPAPAPATPAPPSPPLASPPTQPPAPPPPVVSVPAQPPPPPPPVVSAPAQSPAPPPANVIASDITFEPDHAVLTPSSEATLGQIADMLIATPSLRVEVAGYTDNIGPTGRNLRLSRQRAAVVKAFLVRKGVPADRLTVRGYGSANPIAPNTTTTGRAANRRVELHRLN